MHDERKRTWNVRAERYIRRIESADKGRTEKKMVVAKMADR